MLHGDGGPGRPSEYDSKYCDEVMQYMARGLSLSAFAGHINKSRSRMNVWMGKYPEFAEAVAVGKAKRTDFLERGMLAAKSGHEVSAHRFALVQADPEEWNTVKRIEHSGPNGGPIQTEDMAALAHLSDEELEQLERIRGKLNAGRVAELGSDTEGTGEEG